MVGILRFLTGLSGIGLGDLDMHRHDRRIIIRIGIMTKIARTGYILAMLVKRMIQQLFVIRLALAINIRMKFHVRNVGQVENPHTVSGVRDMRQQHMRIMTKKRHQLFGHTGFEPVDITHADTRIATDMLKAATALADDGRGDKFGMVLIDLCLPF